MLSGCRGDSHFALVIWPCEQSPSKCRRPGDAKPKDTQLLDSKASDEILVKHKTVAAS